MVCRKCKFYQGVVNKRHGVCKNPYSYFADLMVEGGKKAANRCFKSVNDDLKDKSRVSQICNISSGNKWIRFNLNNDYFVLLFFTDITSDEFSKIRENLSKATNLGDFVEELETGTVRFSLYKLSNTNM